MKNKTKFIVLVLTFVLVLPFASIAQDTDDGNSTDTGTETETDQVSPLGNARDILRNRMNQAQDRARDIREDNQERTVQRSEEREERRGTKREAQLRRLKNSMAHHINRMQTAVNKLQNIIDRIEGAASKLNEQGIDTSSVDALLVQAKAEKVEAERLLADAKAKHAAIVDHEHPREAVQEFIASLRALKSQLVQLHGTLKEVVRTLKSLNQGE